MARAAALFGKSRDFIAFEPHPVRRLDRHLQKGERQFGLGHGRFDGGLALEEDGVRLDGQVVLGKNRYNIYTNKSYLSIARYFSFPFMAR